MKGLEIAGFKIEVGEFKKIKYPIGNLPSGEGIDIEVFVKRGVNDGPTLLVIGGIHGDEINGVEIVRRLLQRNIVQSVHTGTIVAIPLVNIHGFINFSRDLPDGKDVNRSFPGINKGSLASRVAFFITNHILPVVDFGVDFHTGGRSHYNYPQIRYSEADEKAAALAGVFRAPYSIEKKTISKSLRKEGVKLGIPIIVFEGGENLRYDGYSIEKGIKGVKRLLAHYQMAPYPTDQPNSIWLNKTRWLRAEKAGMFLWYKSSGSKVVSGEPLGEINSPVGNDSLVIQSPYDGYIIGHNNAPVVNLGDALFNLGFEAENID